MTVDTTWLAAKRHTRQAREERGKPQRYQRRFATEQLAREAVAKWKADPDVKAVWLYAPADAEGNRPLVDQFSTGATT